MTLLFDFGGVLVDLDKERCIRNFQNLGFDIRPYLGTYVQGGFFAEFERGELSTAEFCEKIREASGKNLTDEVIVAAWQSFLLDVPVERLEMLLKIRRHYPVAVLSNTNVVHWDMARHDYFTYQGRSVSDFFDHVFLSCELGVCKPDSPIFQAVCDGTGCPAEDILFFDDSEVNCEAARKFGMQARIAPAGGAWLSYFDEEGRLRE
ncbi:MAG: HAD family phosphatase [Bacteroidaceae bacterium]|nr:HAD family phosphatase [Bacteroidaceae bacterium]